MATKRQNLRTAALNTWQTNDHKCLSVHSAVHFNHISTDNQTDYEITYKDVQVLFMWVKKALIKI